MTQINSNGQSISWLNTILERSYSYRNIHIYKYVYNITIYIYDHFEIVIGTSFFSPWSIGGLKHPKSPRTDTCMLQGG